MDYQKTLVYLIIGTFCMCFPAVLGEWIFTLNPQVHATMRSDFGMCWVTGLVAQLPVALFTYCVITSEWRKGNGRKR